MTPEQAASKFISNIQLYNDRAPELVEALTTLIHAQRAEAVAEAQKWQPIETAPKDGTPILILCILSIYSDIFCASWRHGEPFFYDEGHWYVYDGKSSHALRGPMPIRWMPLPTPPVPQEGEG